MQIIDTCGCEWTSLVDDIKLWLRGIIRCTGELSFGELGLLFETGLLELKAGAIVLTKKGRKVLRSSIKHRNEWKAAAQKRWEDNNGSWLRMPNI